MGGGMDFNYIVKQQYILKPTNVALCESIAMFYKVSWQYHTIFVKETFRKREFWKWIDCF